VLQERKASAYQKTESISINMADKRVTALVVQPEGGTLGVNYEMINVSDRPTHLLKIETPRVGTEIKRMIGIYEIHEGKDEMCNVVVARECDLRTFLDTSRMTSQSRIYLRPSPTTQPVR
jgi:hypothetical protein